MIQWYMILIDNVILDTWYLILDTWYLILDTWYLILDTWYLILDTWYLILDTWYLILDTWYLILIDNVILIDSVILINKMWITTNREPENSWHRYSWRGGKEHEKTVKYNASRNYRPRDRRRVKTKIQMHNNMKNMLTWILSRFFYSMLWKGFLQQNLFNRAGTRLMLECFGKVILTLLQTLSIIIIYWYPKWGNHKTIIIPMCVTTSIISTYKVRLTKPGILFHTCV